MTLPAFRQIWESDSLRGRFTRGAVWSLIGAVMSQGSNLVASVITARLLGREQFGEYGIVQSTVGMFGVFAGMGLGLTATKYVAQFRVHARTRAGRVIALSSAVASGTGIFAVLVLLLSAPWLARNTLNAPPLSAALRIGAALLFLNTVNGLQTGVLAGFEAFRAIARVNVIRGIVTVPFAVTGAIWLGLTGAIIALVAAGAVAWIFNHLAIRTECRRDAIAVHWKSLWSEHPMLWRFSLPALLAGGLNTPVIWAASSMLVNQPAGYAQMGLFSAANQWRTAVTFLPALFSQPLLSMLSNLGAEDPVSFRKLLRTTMLLTFGLSAGMSLPIVLCSSWIMRAYGRDFSAGSPVLILLVIATVISSTATVIGQALASLDRMWWTFAFTAAWAVVFLLLAIRLAPRYGALGLAQAFLAAYLVYGLALAQYAWLLMRGPVSSPKTARQVAA